LQPAVITSMALRRSSRALLPCRRLAFNQARLNSQSILLGSRLGCAALLSSSRPYVSHSFVPRQEWKVDDKVDDYKDVTPSPEDMQSKYVPPPIEVPGKAGEIAGNWYSTANLLNALDAVEKDLKWVQQTLQEVPSFAQFLEVSTLNKDTVKKVLQGALKGAGLHRLTQKFLVVDLVDAGELYLLPEIIPKYLNIMRAHRKEVNVTVTFASLPDKQFLNNVVDRISKYKLKPEQNPKWKFRINPEILGGYQVTAPNLFTYDFSVKAQNDQMKEWLKNFESNITKEPVAEPVIRE